MPKTISRNLLTTAIVVMSLAAPAAASEIVHLKCEISSKGGRPHIWTIDLDERAKTVSYQVNSFSGTKIAIFNADKVVWNKGQNTISRIDLSMVRKNGSPEYEQRGQCRIVTPPKRAF